ncbi:MAG: peroxiredoxin [Acetobacteraceae bacterium]|nr:peroxiredoxin [Acetobacteraceae bacterium]
MASTSAKPARKTSATGKAPAKDAAARRPGPGDAAPAFSLPGTGGRTASSASLAGRPFVLYFYPRANTTGCGREAADFNAALGEFAAAGVAVIGASRDPMPAIERFAAKLDLGFPLASDEDHRVADAYGVWVEKSLYGRRSMGIERSTFLVGADGRIARVWRKVSVAGHAAEVLRAAKAL